MSRRLRINLTDLESAFENSVAECDWFLDLESGDVIMLTYEMATTYSTLIEEAEESGIDFAQALEQSDLADWMKEAVAQADRVEQGFGSTVIGVESDDSSAAFQDMEDFAGSVTNQRVRQQLYAALQGNRPFRRFRDAIAAYPRDEERWFAFRDEQLRKRMRDWLEQEGIELIED